MQLRMLVFAALPFLNTVNADFQATSRNGHSAWIYNDHGPHKARSHVLQALEKAKENLRYLRTHRGRDAVETLLGDLIPALGDPVRGTDFLYVQQSIEEVGIGKEEAKAWAESASKWVHDILEGLDREIGWVIKSDSERGVMLYYHTDKKEWHVDHL